MADMIEVVIDSVRVHLMTPQRVVVLKQVDAERYLPIWVGLYEAEAITVALQEVEMVRPLTHDLLKNVFGVFSAKIVRVEIVKLQEDIFYGSIVARVDAKELHVDSRPSDAIAIAVRAHVPILVHPAVMEAAGIVPDRDLPEGAQAPEATGAAIQGDEGSERLSVFEDFVGKLDLDRLGTDKPADDQPDEPGGAPRPPKPDGPDKPKRPRSSKK